MFWVKWQLPNKTKNATTFNQVRSFSSSNWAIYKKSGQLTYETSYCPNG